MREAGDVPCETPPASSIHPSLKPGVNVIVREQVSQVLKWPLSRIKVIPLEIGGGFGGKIGVYLEESAETA